MEDRFGHRISYLRVSITDRCNERCTYCMPRELQEWLPRADILSFEETLRLIRIAARLGVKKVRVTGGEPLTRRDVLSFMQELATVPGIDDIGVSTNGTLLAREAAPGLPMAHALRAARRAHGQHLARYPRSRSLSPNDWSRSPARKRSPESTPRSPPASS